MAKAGLSILAHVPNLLPQVRKHCAMRESKRPYFEAGWVSLDLGRHTNYTDAIRAATEPDENGKSFAVADEQGRILQTYREYGNAVKARDSVTRVLPTLEVEEDDERTQAGAFA